MALDSWLVKKSKKLGLVTLVFRTVSLDYFKAVCQLMFHYIHIERLALRWIQKYIGAFGGDPTKVTMYNCDLNSPILSRLILFLC